MGTSVTLAPTDVNLLIARFNQVFKTPQERARAAAEISKGLDTWYSGNKEPGDFLKQVTDLRSDMDRRLVQGRKSFPADMTDDLETTLDSLKIGLRFAPETGGLFGGLPGSVAAWFTANEAKKFVDSVSDVLSMPPVKDYISDSRARTAAVGREELGEGMAGAFEPVVGRLATAIAEDSTGVLGRDSAAAYDSVAGTSNLIEFDDVFWQLA